MLSRLICAVSLAAMAAVPAIALPECPTRDGAEILDLLDQAPTCRESLALFEACAYGAGGDVGLSEVVIRKCEGDFLTGLSKSQRQVYDRQQKRCARKHQNQSGSMYRSFEAFCSANLAQDYSWRFAKGPKP